MSVEDEALPAWSLPAEAVERIALPEEWPGEITREWAWGGSTGKGVKVVMIDSGFFNHKFYKSHGFKATVTLGPGAINVKQDDNGHGSAEAANVFATAPAVTFTMIKQGDNSTAAFTR